MMAKISGANQIIDIETRHGAELAGRQPPETRPAGSPHLAGANALRRVIL
jgi:hypothetical protein